MIRITVYTSDRCAYCNAAKALLGGKGIEFNEINLSRDPGLRLSLRDKYKWRTMPLILIGEKLVGGYRELAELDRRGELDSLLKHDEAS